MELTFKGKIKAVDLMSEDTSMASTIVFAGSVNGKYHEVRRYGNREEIKAMFLRYGLDDKEVTLTEGNGEDL